MHSDKPQDGGEGSAPWLAISDTRAMELWLVTLHCDPTLAPPLRAYLFGEVESPELVELARSGGFGFDETEHQGKVMQTGVISEVPDSMRWAVNPVRVAYVDGHYYMPGGSRAMIGPYGGVFLGPESVSFSFSKRPGPEQLQLLIQRANDLVHVPTLSCERLEI